MLFLVWIVRKVFFFFLTVLLKIFRFFSLCEWIFWNRRLPFFFVIEKKKNIEKKSICKISNLILFWNEFLSLLFFSLFLLTVFFFSLFWLIKKLFLISIYCFQNGKDFFFQKSLKKIPFRFYVGRQYVRFRSWLEEKFFSWQEKKLEQWFGFKKRTLSWIEHRHPFFVLFFYKRVENWLNKLEQTVGEKWITFRNYFLSLFYSLEGKLFNFSFVFFSFKKRNRNWNLKKWSHGVHFFWVRYQKEKNRWEKNPILEEEKIWVESESWKLVRKNQMSTECLNKKIIERWGRSKWIQTMGDSWFEFNRRWFLLSSTTSKGPSGPFSSLRWFFFPFDLFFLFFFSLARFVLYFFSFFGFYIIHFVRFWKKR